VYCGPPGPTNKRPIPAHSPGMGIYTGVDLDALIEVGRMAEEIVGHQLPSELIHAGSLDAFRRRAVA
jgi:hypothetical protein